MVSVSNNETRPPRRAPWRRTRFERRLVDFRRFLIRNRWWIRAGAAALVVAGIAGALALGVPREMARGFEFAKTALGGEAGLRVEEITISGLKHLARQDVVAALAIPPGASLVDADMRAARDRVAALGWVKDVTILRLPPDRLHVEIVEYEPRFLWQDGGGSYALDETGHIIAPVDPKRFADLIHLTGDGAAPSAPDLMKWLAAVPEVGKLVISADRIGKRRWNLHLSNQLVVELPDRGLDVAFAALTRMIDKDDLLERDVLEVDLRDPGEPRLRLSEDTMRAMLGPAQKS